jgi:hypothetical protein
MVGADVVTEHPKEHLGVQSGALLSDEEIRGTEYNGIG